MYATLSPLYDVMIYASCTYLIPTLRLPIVSFRVVCDARRHDMYPIVIRCVL